MVDRNDSDEGALQRPFSYEGLSRREIRSLIFHLLYAIVINEAIELAKCFSEDDAYKFVNGILDELVKGMHKEGKNEAQNEA